MCEHGVEHAIEAIGRDGGAQRDLDRVRHTRTGAVAELANLRDHAALDGGDRETGSFAGVGREHRGAASRPDDQHRRVEIRRDRRESLVEGQDSEELFERGHHRGAGGSGDRIPDPRVGRERAGV